MGFSYEGAVFGEDTPTAKRVITKMVRDAIERYSVDMFPDDAIVNVGVPSAAWIEDGSIELIAYVGTFNLADGDREWEVEAIIGFDGKVTVESCELTCKTPRGA